MTADSARHHENFRNRLGNEVRRTVTERSLEPRECHHPTPSLAVPVPALSCLACERDGTTSVKLRMCLDCGAVGCCDSSPGRHAAGHFEATGHPLMRSIEPATAGAGATWTRPISRARRRAVDDPCA